MSNQEALRKLDIVSDALNASADSLRAAGIALNDARYFLGDVVSPPSGDPGEPPPAPQPSPDQPFTVDPSAKSWAMSQPVNDWDRPFLAPLLPFAGPLAEAELELEFIVGPLGFGSTVLEFYRDAKKWKYKGKPKGDTILLLNRGEGGKLSASHTLLGDESDPVRDPLPLKPGDRVHVKATFRSAAWTIEAQVNGRPEVAIRMASPVIDVDHQLGIQVGSHGDQYHQTNDDCSIVSFSAWAR